MRRFALAGILLCMSTLGLALDSPIKTDSPSRYTVEKGDTLWDISTTFLDSPWLWPEIWHANPQIENPHLIFPGDVISLVYINGQPRLMISSRGQSGRTIKLSPKVRVMPGESAIPAIPLSAVQSYLQGGHVFSSEEQLNNTLMCLLRKMANWFQGLVIKYTHGAILPDRPCDLMWFAVVNRLSTHKPMKCWGSSGLMSGPSI